MPARSPSQRRTRRLPSPSRDGFLLASTSASEMATKVQLFVAISEVDVDASKKPITLQNTELAFCILHRDGSLAGIRYDYKCCTPCCEL